ncbi:MULTISPECIES: general secretion pathway protein GspB [unclassified Luteimonas]|uniref:general secretion pathway protein GspB n=1 Tax=unclassified Luteimonas TaxID=2629088 RepID=UPI0016046A8C|nr:MULTISPECIES: general secretion pathway protein GspB [unclassified Luteimonas]MBB1472552.1 general secretion pathway protein GspB [Luteimonas sp. MC1782]MBB6598728.1 general secretion pathway protein GspB [Luteimonas sp. MC1825]QOC88893.1 general secretion pathway protein GspB [Luteimonas sp. MC1825]
MSLILEALRKSEAERRRGEVPGLRVELPPLGSTTRRGMPAWGWLALAGTAVAAVLAFVLLRGVDPAAVEANGGNAAVGDDLAHAVATPPPAPGDARQAGDPDRGDVGMDTLPSVERIVAQTPEPPPAQPQAAVGTTAAGTTALPAGATATAMTPDADVPRVSALPAPPVAHPLPPPAAPQPAAPVPAPMPAQDLPRIAELPASQRERLPALKMTMHMWNADPARRFVIVDGRRLVEGDRVGEATVRTIDADGVVLELDGQVLRLPLR